MKAKITIGTSLLLMCLCMAQAQRQGGARQGGSAQGQRQGQMPGANDQTVGQQQRMRAQQQARISSQATDQQRMTTKQAISAARGLRSQLRSLVRIQKGEQIGTDQAKRWREQMRAQFALMQEQQQALLASLSIDQQSWVAEDVQQLNEATASADDLLDELLFELEQAEVDEQTVKQKAKKVDDKVKKAEREEEQIMEELDLS